MDDMAIAAQLLTYLAAQGAAYDVLEHPPTISAKETAHQARVPSDHMLKAVLLRDRNGYMLAVLPASDRLDLGRLRISLHRRVRLATENEIATQFSDCMPGAIPALGAAYHVDMLVDDSLGNRPDVYFEGGDHRSLIHMKGADFWQLAAGARSERLGAPA
jgi:Ala-tRNA(Pro) deacylase